MCSIKNVFFFISLCTSRHRLQIICIFCKGTIRNIKWNYIIFEKLYGFFVGQRIHIRDGWCTGDMPLNDVIYIGKKRFFSQQRFSARVFHHSFEVVDFYLEFTLCLWLIPDSQKLSHVSYPCRTYILHRIVEVAHYSLITHSLLMLHHSHHLDNILIYTKYWLRQSR